MGKIQNFFTKSSLLICILAISIVTCACSENAHEEPVSQNDLDDGEVIYIIEDADTTVNSQPELTKKDGVFDMSIAGDYIIYDSIYGYANMLANGDGYDFKPIVRNLRKFTKNCDVNYYNQETVLAGDELPPSTYPMFVSPTEAGDAMLDVGYNLVSTATNHSLDGGEDGVIAECNYWKNNSDKAFMTGTFTSQKERDEVHILECNGITYSMLDYTYSTNGIPLPEGKEYLVNVWPTDFDINDPKSDKEYQDYKKQVKKDIEAVRDKVDFLIVCMHSGVEYADDESEYQRDTAKFLADNGVNLVIGTHPHAIQPAEYIGDTLVYYSLGNLLCAQTQDLYYKKVTSILATMTIRKTTENGETKIYIENVKNHLMFSYYNPATWLDYCVVSFEDPLIKTLVPDYESIYQTYSEQFLKRDDKITLEPCC